MDDTEPTTDPRAPGPVPLAVLSVAAWLLRREANVAAQLCERLAREARDPDVRALSGALQKVLYQLAGLGTTAPRPRYRVGVLRRWWRAVFG